MPTYASAHAVLDACVLYPPTLRDTLLRLAETGLLRPHWSEAILDEVARNLRDADLTEAQVQHLLVQMRRAFPEALVEGYEGRLAEARNHPKDRHVVAAALHAGVSLIVTDNLKDFRTEDMPEGLEAQSADDFLVGLLERSAPIVAACLRAQAKAYRKRTMTTEDVLERLARRVPRFAQAARGALAARTDAQLDALHARMEAVLTRMQRGQLGPDLWPELSAVYDEYFEAFPEARRRSQAKTRAQAAQWVRAALQVAQQTEDLEAQAQARGILVQAGFGTDLQAIARMKDEEMQAMMDRLVAPKH